MRNCLRFYLTSKRRDRSLSNEKYIVSFSIYSHHQFVIYSFSSNTHYRFSNYIPIAVRSILLSDRFPLYPPIVYDVIKFYLFYAAMYSNQKDFPILMIFISCPSLFFYQFPPSFSSSSLAASLRVSSASISL